MHTIHNIVSEGSEWYVFNHADVLEGSPDNEKCTLYTTLSARAANLFNHADVLEDGPDKEKSTLYTTLSAKAANGICLIMHTP